ncbi:hypothetical protein Trydic_g8084 [Trypoxylus dichotomus]
MPFSFCHRVHGVVLHPKQLKEVGAKILSKSFFEEKGVDEYEPDYLISLEVGEENVTESELLNWLQGDKNLLPTEEPDEAEKAKREEETVIKNNIPMPPKIHHKHLIPLVPCGCGIFLSGQFEKGSKEQPKGLPALTQEVGGFFPNNPIGIKQCTSKCLDMIIKHLPKSSDIICATIDRDCYKERAYLFIQNHSTKWINSKMSAGREFCCKNNLPYKCPL